MHGLKLFLLFGTPIVSALVLIHLLLPGTLIASSDLDVQSTQALEDRLERLRECVRTNSCVVPPGAPTIIAPGQDAERAFRPVPVDPETSEVPDIVKSSSTDGAGTGLASGNATGSDDGSTGAKTLADLIRQGTVLILAKSAGLGSGFVVDDQHIVTNFHVVKGATQIFATSRESGRLIELQVVATAEGDAISGTADLALLRSEAPLGLGRLPLATFPNEMDGVFAAGYPGFVVATDNDFQSLVAGDFSSAPGIVITQGRVSAIQNRESPSPLVVHSAEISEGNSGGPLIDECGRVVGINTFGRTDKENAANRTVYYSQPPSTALQVFAGAGADFSVIEGYCGTLTKKDVSAGASATGTN